MVNWPIEKSSNSRDEALVKLSAFNLNNILSYSVSFFSFYLIALSVVANEPQTTEKYSCKFNERPSVFENLKIEHQQHILDVLNSTAIIEPARHKKGFGRCQSFEEQLKGGIKFRWCWFPVREQAWLKIITPSSSQVVWRLDNCELIEKQLEAGENISVKRDVERDVAVAVAEATVTTSTKSNSESLPQKSDQPSKPSSSLVSATEGDIESPTPSLMDVTNFLTDVQSFIQSSGYNSSYAELALSAVELNSILSAYEAAAQGAANFEVVIGAFKNTKSIASAVAGFDEFSDKQSQLRELEQAERENKLRSELEIQVATLNSFIAANFGKPATIVAVELGKKVASLKGNENEKELNEILTEMSNFLSAQNLSGETNDADDINQFSVSEN